MNIKADELNERENIKIFKCVHEMQRFLQSKKITEIQLNKLPINKIFNKAQ